jgi:hypothetical protein
MPAPQVVVVQLHWPSLVTVGQVGSAGSAGKGSLQKTENKAR